jgi:hypothetical protein
LYRQTVAGGCSDRSVAGPKRRIAAGWSSPIRSLVCMGGGSAGPREVVMASDPGCAEDGGAKALPDGFGEVMAGVSAPEAEGSAVGGAGLRGGRGTGRGRGGTSAEGCGNKLTGEVRGCSWVSLPEHDASKQAPMLSRAG